jgi:hypothetical protein
VPALRRVLPADGSLMPGQDALRNRSCGLTGTLSRRQVGRLLGLGALAPILTACGAATTLPSGAVDTDGKAAATDFSARFAGFAVADEPNGDLAKVVWPGFVTKAGPDVKQLYEFQVTHGELMRWMPCFCGCGQSSGHQNNRDCYVKAVNPDGSVVFDSMAPT